MKFKSSLTEGVLIRRYKRFLADVRLADGSEVTAHCANPGAMTGLAHPGEPVWLSKSDNPKRKLAYSLEIVSPPEGGLVGINTSHPNGIVADAIAAGRIPQLSGYETLQREVRYGEKSRVDIYLTAADRPPAYVEVKNVHLMRTPGLAEFPDSVTTRGAKHLRELTSMAESGARAIMVYLIQRTDCSKLAFAGDLDPQYSTAFADAHSKGVEAFAFDCDISVDEIKLRSSIPIVDTL